MFCHRVFHAFGQLDPGSRMRRRWAGNMVLEATMAVTLVSVALIGVAQFLVVVGRQQRVIEWRRLANREAGNVMEQIMARSFEDLTTEGLAGIAISSDARRRLPAAKLMIELETVNQQAAARQVQIEIGWQNLAGQREHARLVAWKYEAVR